MEQFHSMKRTITIGYKQADIQYSAVALAIYKTLKEKEERK